MVDITNVLNSTQASTASTTAKAPNVMDKDTFMQLLITQISNQDPLNPMDNTQFISELAQFSSLEQMQNVASGMNNLSLSQSAATNSQMVNLIGKRVIAPSDTITISGSNPVALNFQFDQGDKIGILAVTDKSGHLVRNVALQNLVPGKNTFSFDGKDNAGNQLANGNYQYQIVAVGANPFVGLKTYGNLLIDAVAFDGSTISLRSGSTSVAAADISEVIAN